MCVSLASESLQELLSLAAGCWGSLRLGAPWGGTGLSFLPSGLCEPEVSAMEPAPRARLAFAPASAEVVLSRVPWEASCEGLSCSSEAPRHHVAPLQGFPRSLPRCGRKRPSPSVRGWSLRGLCGVVCPAPFPTGCPQHHSQWGWCSLWPTWPVGATGRRGDSGCVVAAGLCWPPAPPC